MSAKLLTDINVGDRFGKAVVRQISMGKKSQRHAACLCDCGKEFSTNLSLLRRGKITSCHSCAIKRAWMNVRRLSADELFLRKQERRYRHEAMKKDRPWLLDTETFRAKMEAPCEYCGMQPAEGIDRRDNTQGYTPENADPCCVMCNYAKRDWPEAKFRAWILRLIQHQGFDL